MGDTADRNQDGGNGKVRWWRRRLKITFTFGFVMSSRPACDAFDPVSNQIEKVKKPKEPADWIVGVWGIMRYTHITCLCVYMACMCRTEVDIRSLPQLLSTLLIGMHFVCVHRQKSEDKLGMSGLSSAICSPGLELRLPLTVTMAVGRTAWTSGWPRLC